MTVSGEIRSTAAVSSTLRPPKKRNSTTRLLRSSNFASADNASSSATQIVCFLRHGQRVGERDPDGTAASLLILPGSREVHEDAAHQSGGHREKVRPILPVHVLRIHKPEVGLVDESGGLEAVARSFAAHAASGDPLQLLMDEGGESSECGLVARSPRQ